MLTPLLITLLAQAEARPVAVVPSNARPGAEAFTAKVVKKVKESLEHQGVVLLPDAKVAKELRVADPSKCAGSPSCVRKLAVLLGPRAVVVGVDVGKIAKSLAIHLEGVAADSNGSLATMDITAPADTWANVASADLNFFASTMKKELEKPEPVAVVPDEPVKDTPPDTDAPKEEPPKITLVPKEAPKQPKIGITQRPKPVRPLPWSLLGGAVIAAGVGGAFVGLGMADKGRYDASLLRLPDGTRGTSLTATEANALADGANAKMTVALTSGVIAVLLAAASTYFFIEE